jgi:hypothetical protein
MLDGMLALTEPRVTKIGGPARNGSPFLGYDRRMRAHDRCCRAPWAVVESTRVWRPMGTQS